MSGIGTIGRAFNFFGAVALAFLLVVGLFLLELYVASQEGLAVVPTLIVADATLGVAFVTYMSIRAQERRRALDAWRMREIWNR